MTFNNTRWKVYGKLVYSLGIGLIKVRIRPLSRITHLAKPEMVLMLHLELYGEDRSDLTF